MPAPPVTHRADGRRHRDAPFAERFASSYEVVANGCHLWLRAKNNRGYGVIWYQRKVRLAHRVAWHLRYGSWPSEAHVLDHVCETKQCVNPDHLREVTNRFNVLRSPASPMNTARAATACRNSHPYPLDVQVDAHGWRICPTCAARRRRGWTS